MIQSQGNDPTQRQPIEIELNRQLDLAVFFYQTLVLTLRAQGGKAVDECKRVVRTSLKSYIFKSQIGWISKIRGGSAPTSNLVPHNTIVYKSLIYLGDLCEFLDSYG